MALLPGMAAAADPRRAGAGTPAQSLHDAIASAWERLPQRRAFAAQQASAGARYAAGGAFLPNAPSITGSYVNDKVAGSNYNYITSQIQLTTPVWLPGEGTATQSLAQADAAAASAAAEAAHLALAAQVLDLAMRGTEATNARDVALRRLTTDKALADDLGRRFRLGESSQSDFLAATAEAASAEAAFQGAEAQLAATRLALAAMTGMDAVPRLDLPVPVPAVTAADPLAVHPRVLAAERSVAAARANARLVRIGNRDDPEVGLQGINEKQFGSPWDTRVGVTLSFHFATEARNAPRRTEAEQAVTQAEVQLALARREVTAAVKQAKAILAGAEAGSAAAGRAAAELEQRRGQIERAWRLGEMPLIEVVRANGLAFDAAFARDKARTDRDAAFLQLRLAQGILP